jgi:hypothetical protein
MLHNINFITIGNIYKVKQKGVKRRIVEDFYIKQLKSLQRFRNTKVLDLGSKV